jgi:hypothetical protein
LRKATISSVRPSIRMEQLGSHLTNIHESWHLNIFRKSAQKVQVSLKSDKNNGYLSWTPMCIYDNISSSSFLEWEMLHNVVEKIKPHILCAIKFFQNSCRLWDSVENYGRATHDNIRVIRRMRIACWINKATDTHSEYAILIEFPRHQWLLERACVLRSYVYCLSSFSLDLALVPKTLLTTGTFWDITSNSATVTFFCHLSEFTN